jgi:Kef-type K+ transport system membrane component KefB
MTFAELTLICLVALAGPLLALPRGIRLPVVIGEIIVGLALGRSGLGLLDPGDPTLSFLAEIGFALVMLVAGTHVPLRRLVRGGTTGLLRAVLVGALAAGAGGLLGWAFGTGHGALYAVVLASSSAAVIVSP